MRELPIAPNIVNREFDVSKIEKNRVWSGNITYIRTREGWLYLAVVLDLASRRVVGWSMQQTMQRELVVDALQPRSTIVVRLLGSSSIPIAEVNTRAAISENC